MRMIRHLLLCLALWFGAVMLLFAQDTAAAPQWLYLNQSLELRFVPDEAIFIVQDQELKILPGVIVPPFREVSPERANVWAAGVRLAYRAATPKVRFAVVFRNKAGELAYLEPQRLDLVEEGARRASPAALREYLLKRKELLKSWEAQLQAQDEALARLRADADVIANLGRIVEIREEIERTKLEIAGLDKDAETLQRFVRLVKSRLPPKNFMLREAQLTKQLAQLAEAARQAEAEEFQRKVKSEAELQKKLALVEATRQEDLAALEKTLAELKAKRESLQGQPTGTARLTPQAP